MPTVARGNGSDPQPVRAKQNKPAPESKEPSRFTYALKAWTAERRADGWYVAQTVASFAGERVHWRGPFATIETACLSIARGLALELADRHTRQIEAHKLAPAHPLCGITTRLAPRAKASTG